MTSNQRPARPASDLGFFYEPLEKLGSIIKNTYQGARLLRGRNNTPPSIFWRDKVVLAGRAPLLSARQEQGSGTAPIHSGQHSSDATPNSNAKEKYRALCSGEASVPLFARDWWLDAAAGPDGWNVAVVEKGGKIVAALPYVQRRKLGFCLLGQAPLTPSLGPWFAPGKEGSGHSLSQQKEIMAALIAGLPRFDHYAQNWHYRNANWLPFYWKGFQQTTRYTYVLQNIQDAAKLKAGFQHHVRNEINKASSRFQLQVRQDLPLDALFALNHKTFQRQGKSLPYTDDYARRLDAACAKRACSKLFVAVDPAGLHHAAVYIVWDENSAYYLMGGGDPALRTSGAASLCVWEAISYAAGVTRQFDFEGSMLEPVEHFFRYFGGAQMPYSHVSKTPSRLLRTRESLLSVIGRP